MPNPVFESVTPPFTTFRFEVILNLNKPMNGISDPVCSAAFAECSGLEISMQPESFTQGGDNQMLTHLKNKVTYGQLTLNRGMTASKHLWIWMEAAGAPGVDARANGTVKMLNPDGSTATVFKLFDCLPVSLRGPSLNARTRRGGDRGDDPGLRSVNQWRVRGRRVAQFLGGFWRGRKRRVSVSASAPAPG